MKNKSAIKKEKKIEEDESIVLSICRQNLTREFTFVPDSTQRWRIHWPIHTSTTVTLRRYKPPTMTLPPVNCTHSPFLLLSIEITIIINLCYLCNLFQISVFVTFGIMQCCLSLYNGVWTWLQSELFLKWSMIYHMHCCCFFSFLGQLEFKFFMHLMINWLLLHYMLFRILLILLILLILHHCSFFNPFFGRLEAYLSKSWRV